MNVAEQKLALTWTIKAARAAGKLMRDHVKAARAALD